MTKAISEAATDYAERGWAVVPTLGKVPNGGKEWQLQAATDGHAARKLFGFCRRDGVGVILGPRSGIIDIECDDARAEELFLNLFDGIPPETATFTSTRGKHRLFKWREGLPNADKAVFKIGQLEFRTGNGKAAQTVFPPSGGRTWTTHPNDCDVAEIPDDVLEKIFDEMKPKAKRNNKPKLSPDEVQLKRAKAYLERVPAAVSGQRGHDQTFKAAVKLRAFGLDRGEMISLLSDWNQTCDPPWTDAELEHKVDDAIAADPEPMPDRPTSTGGGASEFGEFKVIEAGDDPHRLARLFIAQNYRLQNGLQKLAWWQGSYWTWDGLRWRELKKHELIASLTACVKAEFDRINIWEQENWVPKTEEEQPPKVKPVTKALLNNVDNAVASILAIPDHTLMPDWLSGDPPFPAHEVLSTVDRLIHLPSLISGGTFSIATTPMLFTANCLNYSFDAPAACPYWFEFLNSVWRDDAESIESLQEWFGYLLLPDTRQHKLLMLIGPPRSGKGTITRVLQRLLGEGNVASPTLSSLAGAFGLWPLLNKYVAIIPDARLSGRDDSIAVVERILSISGEDPQDVHRKNLPTLTGIRMPVRFVLMSNELPNMKDSSGALMTRVILLRMLESFAGREDRSLGGKLDKELSGILNWAIEGWKRLHQRGHLLQPGSATELLTDLENLSSPIKQFIADACDLGPAHESTVTNLFHAWKRWCEGNHREHMGTTQTFGRDLRAAVPQLTRTQRRNGDERERGYMGIAPKFDVNNF